MRSAMVRAAMRRGWVWPMLVPAELEADLRELRRLARPGLAGDDHDLVVADGARDLLPLLADRQLGREVESGGETVEDMSLPFYLLGARRAADEGIAVGGARGVAFIHTPSATRVNGDMRI